MAEVMSHTSHSLPSWLQRIRSIDAQAAMRWAPVSWQVIQHLLPHGEAELNPLNEAVKGRICWHLEQVEQVLAACSQTHRSQVDVPPIQWPAGGADRVEPLATWQAMRQWHAGHQIRRQLQRSLEQAWRHAGPLHSERLVQQSLMRMNSISPAYLQRFLTHVDALAALEDAGQPRGIKTAVKKSKAPKTSVKPPA